MKKTALSVLGIFSIFSFFAPVQASFFDESIDDIVAAASSDTVEGLSVTPGNGSAILIWNTKYDTEGEEAAQYRVEYGTESVVAEEVTKYESQETTFDNIPSIKIEDLENDTRYYFSVVALFSDGSETPLSDEVTTTPISELEQRLSETPIVISAEAVDNETIRVLFSEDIRLPEENSELAFVVTEDVDESSVLEVDSVGYDADEDTGEETKQDVLVKISTPQTEGVSYRITVSAQITDTEGNAIESGSTDSAVFTGTSEPPSVLAEELTGEEGNQEDGMYDPEAEGLEGLIGELDGIGDEADGAFSEIIPNAIGEGITLEDILSGLDEDSSVTESTAFDGSDTTPPEDITNLTHTLKARLTDYLVQLSWTASQNSAGDLDDQLLYRSEKEEDEVGTTWENPMSLGKDATSTEVAEKPETDVVYKITTTDVAGNESVGVIRSIRIPRLPETGNILLIAAGIALAGAGMRRIRK